MNGGCQRPSPCSGSFIHFHPISSSGFLQGTHLQINPKDFPNAQKEIAVPTLVMELKDALEALKPKPKEQAGLAWLLG
jgi:hypothetical protein